MQIDRDQISTTEKIIRPHIRRTTILEADGGDFGLDSIPLIFKLELLQHSGSFKRAALSLICCCERFRKLAWSQPREVTTERPLRLLR
jgi:hypothetical protein